MTDNPATPTADACRYRDLVRRAERIVEALGLIGADPTRLRLMRTRLGALSHDVDGLIDAVTAAGLQRDLAERRQRHEQH